MKKSIHLVLLVLVFFTIIIPNIHPKEKKNITDGNILAVFMLPRNYGTLYDEILKKEVTASPAILVFLGLKRDHAAAYWIKYTDSGSKKIALKLRIAIKRSALFNEVTIKIGNKKLRFSKQKNNLLTERQVKIYSENRLNEEHLYCFMNRKDLEDIISAKVFTISVDGENASETYEVFKEPKWESVLEF